MGRPRKHESAKARAAAGLKNLRERGGKRVTVDLDAEAVAALAQARQMCGVDSDRDAISWSLRRAIATSATTPDD